jgi:hypothetical protein
MKISGKFKNFLTMGLCILASGFMETANSWQAVRYFPISEATLILQDRPSSRHSNEEVLIAEVTKRTPFCHESGIAKNRYK